MHNSERSNPVEIRPLFEIEKGNLNHLKNLRFETVVELGRKRLSLAEVKSVAPGTVIDLPKLCGVPCDLLVNGHPFAHGEIVVETDLLSLRITEMHPPVTTPAELVDESRGEHTSPAGQG